MHRRKFLKHTAALAPLIVAFDPFAVAQKNFLGSLLNNAAYTDRILVLIQLNGGNDGLNTFIPLDKYNILSQVRKNILIPENKVLKLNDTNIFGLHPSVAGLQDMYNNKMVSFITGVGYPNPDFSHFHGINIKYTANVEKKEIRSGWLGRYLQQDFAGYPAGYPKKSIDGPPAMRIGVTVSPRITQGEAEDFSIGISNISDFNSLTTTTADMDTVEAGMGGANVDIIRALSAQIKVYAPIIQNYAGRQETLSKMYPGEGSNSLADQLKIVAKLIGSGLNTRIYVVNQSGYDTHGEQVDHTDTTKGKHANLLKNLSEAIVAFEDDLHLMGKQDKVLGMTFSEFGRRIVSSASYGTDHGTAETVILFGTKVKNGIIGASPEIPAQPDSEDNLPVQFDFRALYASVLKGWFGLPEEKIKTIITQGPADRLNLIRA